MNELIGRPLYAMCEAQMQLAMATANFLEQAGLAPGQTSADAPVRTVASRPAADPSFIDDPFRQLPMFQLIGGPLQAAADAQMRLAEASAALMEQAGRVPPGPSGNDPADPADPVSPARSS